jgi:hypothetical protein
MADMADSSLSVVIHGHFYQPPRDDPWLEMVEAQASARPFHDWNERVTKECYRAVVAARRPGPGGRIARIVNTLERISFNFGPTLLQWMEQEAPSIYHAILQADAVSSQAHQGHGNAIAQAYHHTILPLASRREKVTEVRWGISDFRKRFRREPLGMWLPETAVDDETLDVLAQEGIRFTILAPHQVTEPPPRGLPGVYRTGRGRSLTLFLYDGPISQGVAFGPLLQDAQEWAKSVVETGRRSELDDPEDRRRRVSTPESGALVCLATDGETYGHHHRFGEMALAAVLDLLDRQSGVRVENFASFLSRVTPEHQVELVEPSSWSCPHGVERWRSGCGCRMDPEKASQQEWRRGLRDAVEWLASRIHEIFEEEGPPLLGDVWAARNAYGIRDATGLTDVRALELLELERNALRLFTSCGWFFDDLAGIEPRQILRYAARALDLSGSRESELEAGFLNRLDEAVSNETPPRTGRTIFLQEAKPRIPAHLRVAGGLALWEAVTRSPGASEGSPEVREAEQGLRPGETSPGVPGYATSKTAPDRVLVTHGRTGRAWEVETRIPEPRQSMDTVRVRVMGEETPFLGMTLNELPEGFRGPITRVLLQREPDPGGRLVEAIQRLGESAEVNDPDLQGSVERALDLVDLLLLLERPIPFDAQTLFFGILNRVPTGTASRLTELREALGFTPDS